MVARRSSRTRYVLEIPPRLIPEPPTLDNFVEAWSSNDFGRYFLNSVFVAMLSTVVSVSLAAMLGFVFARYEFPGRRVLFGALLFTIMVPGLVLLIPQFVLARNLGLLNSLWGLVVVYAVLNLGLNTFLLRGFFAAMPQEMFDAAEVDGAGAWRSVPVRRPAAGQARASRRSRSSASSPRGTSSPGRSSTLSDSELYTLPIAIRLFQRAKGTEWGLVFAASLIALAPVLVLFVALQRHFVAGAFVGATKG